MSSTSREPGDLKHDPSVRAHAPEGDPVACAKALALYRECLADEATIMPWTFERIVDALETERAGAWVGAFRERYPDFDRLPA